MKWFYSQKQRECGRTYFKHHKVCWLQLTEEFTERVTFQLLSFTFSLPQVHPTVPTLCRLWTWRGNLFRSWGPGHQAATGWRPCSCWSMNRVSVNVWTMEVMSRRSNQWKKRPDLSFSHHSRQPGWQTAQVWDQRHDGSDGWPGHLGDSQWDLEHRRPWQRLWPQPGWRSAAGNGRWGMTLLPGCVTIQGLHLKVNRSAHPGHILQDRVSSDSWWGGFREMAPPCGSRVK